MTAKSNLWLVAGAALLALSGSLAVAAEAPPVFKASKILPAEVLSSPIYQVEEEVRNNGFVNLYKVTVHDKTYGVTSNAGMELRLRELAALEQMEEVQRGDVYLEAVKKGATAPLRLAKGLVTEPVDTVGDVVSGVGTFAESIGHSLFGGASEQEDGALKTALGVDAAKRKFAYDFGIDPYTSFPPVSERLNEIAWAATGGGLTVAVGFKFTPSPVNTILGVTKLSQGMRQLVRDNTPAELKEINAGKLARLGVDDDVSGLFLEHPKFSPTQKTLLVEALASMQAKGAEAFIERAILVQDDDMALFMRRWAEAFAAYHHKVKPVERFVRIGKATYTQRPDGVLIGVFPVDHLVWTDDLAKRHATNMQSLSDIENITGGEIWLEGSISPEARAALEAGKWVVKDNAGSSLGLN